MKTVNLDDLIAEALLKDQAKVTIDKTELHINLMKNPKRYAIGVTTSKGGHHGVSCGTDLNMEVLKSHARSMWLNITKTELPEDQEPPMRKWYFQVRGGRLHPFCLSRYKPDLNEYLILNEDTNEEEYLFNLPLRMAPELDYDREGDNIYIPKLHLWGITDYSIKPVYLLREHGYDRDR